MKQIRWWDILNLPQTATPKEVNTRCKLLATKLHPDKVGDEFSGLFRLVQDLKEIATSPKPIEPPPPPKSKSKSKSPPFGLDPEMIAEIGEQILKDTADDLINKVFKKWKKK